MADAIKARLRQIRSAQTRAIAAAIAGAPALERPFIAAGRWLARRSRLLGTLYWFAQDNLLPRLRLTGHRFRTLNVAGVAMEVDVTDHSGRSHYFYGDPYEPDLARAIRERLQPGDVFLDVGANVGFFSVLAARLVGSTGHVVAFEPHPDAAANLRRALAVNRVEDVVEVVEAAVGDAHGTVRLFLSEDSVLSTTDPARSPARDHYSFSRYVNVARVTLDGWLAARPELTPRIRAVKIDVEGTEAEVLTGLRATLDRGIPQTVFCETESGSPADTVLRQSGFRSFPLESRPDAVGNFGYERLP